MKRPDEAQRRKLRECLETISKTADDDTTRIRDLNLSVDFEMARADHGYGVAIVQKPTGYSTLTLTVNYAPTPLRPRIQFRPKNGRVPANPWGTAKSKRRATKKQRKK